MGAWIAQMFATNGGVTSQIMLVEDNPGDLRLIREVFRECGYLDNLLTLTEGEQALAYLKRNPPYPDAARPDLILLDLNLPGRNGFEVLHEIKKNPDLRSIPVIILSSSQNPADISMAYDFHANCYVAKPGQLDELISTIQAIQNYWLRTAMLPTERNLYARTKPITD